MGSARVTNSTASDPTMENSDKKPFKPLTIIANLFAKKKEKQKSDKKCSKDQKDSKKEHEIKKDVKPPPKPEDTMAAVLKNFEAMSLKARKEQQEAEKLNFKNKEVNPENSTPKNADNSEDDDGISDNFAFKVIQEEPRNERINSQSSEDSGFSDINNSDKTEPTHNAECENLTKDLEKLDIDEKKTKKLQTVFLSRPPIRNKCRSNEPCPYPVQDFIHANKNTLSGGQVIINQCSQQDNLTEFDTAIQNVQRNSQYLQTDKDDYLNELIEYINEDTIRAVQETLAQETTAKNATETSNQQEKPEDLLQLIRETRCNLAQMQEFIPKTQPFVSANPNFQPSDIIEKDDITQMLDYVQKDLNMLTDDTFLPNYSDYQVPSGYLNTFPTPPYSDSTYLTPPRSDIVKSPMTLSPGSLYPSNSECSYSPQSVTFSPISQNEDLEKFIEINQIEDENEVAVRGRTESSSSMTMKNFKDLQKEIAGSFSDKQCCQIHRKSCKELIQERLQKLKMVERKNLCIMVAKLDLKTAYGVLHNILLSISRGSEQEDLEFGLFGLVCDRILGQDTGLFLSNAGLSLLKSAALRCPHKPLLTRYLVQCIRTAYTADPAPVAGKEYIFHEVDALGDTLVSACARAGDRCADVLSEIVRAQPSQPSLFRLTHTNSEGYSALHVACSQHSSADPRLHTVHVLVEHGGLSITDGDVKGGDTALHLAVYSANCDLKLILLLFKQADRKDWKNLAHWKNSSSKTPIDLARMATKSTTRQNYPQEVLEFLKKCR